MKPQGDTQREVFDELHEAITEAVSHVEERINQPAKEVADQIGRVSFWASLKETVSPHLKEQLKTSWKNLKALVAGGIALAPVLGELGSSTIVAQELIDAAVLEGATLEQAQALATQGAEVLESGVVAQSAGSILTKEFMQGLNKALKTVDPFEDVHKIVVLAAAGAEMVGLHGALAIPAALQLAKGEFEMMKQSVFITYDVGNLVLSELKERLAKANQPEMTSAIAAFA